jgi:hypothetical protein
VRSETPPVSYLGDGDGDDGGGKEALDNAAGDGDGEALLPLP